MSCHISKFADMTESFMWRKKGEFHEMREECHHHDTLSGIVYQVPSLGNCAMILLRQTLINIAKPSSVDGRAHHSSLTTFNYIANCNHLPCCCYCLCSYRMCNFLRVCSKQLLEANYCISILLSVLLPHMQT